MGAVPPPEDPDDEKNSDSFIGISADEIKFMVVQIRLQEKLIRF